MVFQDCALFLHLTVQDNFRIGPHRWPKIRWSWRTCPVVTTIRSGIGAAKPLRLGDAPSLFHSNNLSEEYAALFEVAALVLRHLAKIGPHQ